MLFSYQNTTNPPALPSESDLEFWAPFITIAAVTTSFALLFHYCKYKGYCPERPLIDAVPINIGHGTTWLSTRRLLDSGETETDTEDHSEEVATDESIKRRFSIF